MTTYIDNSDWYSVLLVAGGVFLGKVFYSILSGIISGIRKSLAKESFSEQEKSK